MAIKSYTDIEQSRKLSKILPLKSADMRFCFSHTLGGRITGHYPMIGREPSMGTIPCWSQTALYNILPVVIGNVLKKNALRLRLDKGETDFNVWYDNLDTGSVVEDLDVVESNPVDAYYEMICKLHKRGLL